MYREQTTGTKQTNSSTVFHSERFRQYLPGLGLKASPNPAVVVVAETELVTVDLGSSFSGSSEKVIGLTLRPATIGKLAATLCT